LASSNLLRHWMRPASGLHSIDELEVPKSTAFQDPQAS